MSWETLRIRLVFLQPGCGQTDENRNQMIREPPIKRRISGTRCESSGSENYGDSELMQNTKIRGQSNFGSRSIGIGWPANAATAGKVGGLVVNRDLLWWWRNRRLPFGFEGVV